MKTDPHIGTARRYMIKAATRAGFYCYVNDNAPLRELKRLISEGCPVIIRFVEPSNDEDHYAVACGYVGNRIIINDPWNGKNFTLSLPSFLARWRDSDGTHAGWMMALSTEDFRLGRQYRPAASTSAGRFRAKQHLSTQS